MAKRWAISREQEYIRTRDIVAGGIKEKADYFFACYDSKDKALDNAAKFSLDHDCAEVTIFEAVETVKASIPCTIEIIPAGNEAVEP